MGKLPEHRKVERVHVLDAHPSLAAGLSEDELAAARRYAVADVAKLPPGTYNLSHGDLAELVGAQRPSVSVALKRLAEDELVKRASDSGWMLSHEPPSELRDMRPYKVSAIRAAAAPSADGGPEIEEDFERLVASG